MESTFWAGAGSKRGVTGSFLEMKVAVVGILAQGEGAKGMQRPAGG